MSDRSTRGCGTIQDPIRRNPFGPAEAIGFGVGAVLGLLALAFTGPIALLGAAVGAAIGTGAGRLISLAARAIARRGSR